MAKIKSVRVGFGLTQPTGPGGWLKANAEIEIEFDNPDDYLIKDTIWKDAWDRVTDEVAGQLQRLDSK